MIFHVRSELEMRCGYVSSRVTLIENSVIGIEMNKIFTHNL